MSNKSSATVTKSDPKLQKSKNSNAKPLTSKMALGDWGNEQGCSLQPSSLPNRPNRSLLELCPNYQEKIWQAPLKLDKSQNLTYWSSIYRQSSHFVRVRRIENLCRSEVSWSKAKNLRENEVRDLDSQETHFLTKFTQIWHQIIKITNKHWNDTYFILIRGTITKLQNGFLICIQKKCHLH